MNDYQNFTITVREGEVQSQMYRNPFDIPRAQLIDQLTRMRANFLQVEFLIFNFSVNVNNSDAAIFLLSI